MTSQKKLIILVALIVILIILSACQKKPFPKINEVESKISSAIDQFKKSNIEEGINSVMDAIILTAPHAELPAKVETKIIKAKEHFKSTDILNEKGFKLVWEAFQLIKPGFDRSDDQSGTSPVAQIFRNKLFEAQDELKKGNTPKVVELLLESILLLRPL